MRLPGAITIQLQGKTCLQLIGEDGPCQEGMKEWNISKLI
jgi:hypothetical protein